ncbi:hypothetical protein BK006_00335 [bacterium CG10_49_38]|nr:MAG: hypothetical protein BK006_00335 [bacterium CG10_49_38]
MLAFVVAAAHPRAAMSANGVDLINKNNRRGRLLGHIEEIAHSRGAHAHKHLHKFRSREIHKRYLGLAGHGPGQQGLASAGRAHQEHALGDAGANVEKLFRIAQEIHDLAQLFFGLLDAGHVAEGDSLTVIIGVNQARPRLTEGEGLSRSPLHLSRQEPKQHHDKNNRNQNRQDVNQPEGNAVSVHHLNRHGAQRLGRNAVIDE